MTTSKSKSSKSASHPSANKRNYTVFSDIPDNNGPFLVTFPSVKVASDVVFHAYKPSVTGHGTHSRHTKQRVLAAETDKVIYSTQATNLNSQPPKMYCQYIIGELDETNGVLRLKQVPLMATNIHIKGILSRDAVLIDKSKYKEDRWALGEAFGTRKSKSRMLAVRKNIISGDALDQASSTIQNIVEENMTYIPTQEELAVESTRDLLIPIYNATTSDVTKVYEVHNIISPHEMRLMSDLAKEVGRAKSQEQLQELLGKNPSTYILRSLSTILASRKKSSKDALRISMLLYMHFLFHFRTTFTGPSGRNAKAEKLVTAVPNLPTGLAHELLKKFAEKIDRGGGRVAFSFSDRDKERLINWILVLALHVDDFSLDIAEIAADLLVTTAKLKINCASIGCSPESLTVSQSNEMGLSGFDPVRARRITLKAPIILPDPLAAVRKQKARR